MQEEKSSAKDNDFVLENCVSKRKRSETMDTYSEVGIMGGIRMDAQRKMFLKERQRLTSKLDRGYSSPDHCQYCKYGEIPPKKEIYSGTCNLAAEIITKLKRCPLLDNPDKKEFIRRIKINEPLFLCLDKSAFDINKWAHDRLEFFNPKYKRDRPMDERQTMLFEEKA